MQKFPEHTNYLADTFDSKKCGVKWTTNGASASTNGGAGCV